MPHSMSQSDVGSETGKHPISTWCPLSQEQIYDMFGLKTALEWQAQSALMVEARQRHKQHTFTADIREARQLAQRPLSQSRDRTGVLDPPQTRSQKGSLLMPSELQSHKRRSPTVMRQAAPKTPSSWATTAETRLSLPQSRVKVKSRIPPLTVTMQPPSEPYSTADWTEDEQTPPRQAHHRTHTTSGTTQGEPCSFFRSMLILIQVTASTMPFYHQRALYDDTTPDRGRRMREEYLAVSDQRASPNEQHIESGLLNSSVPLESSDVLGAHLQNPDRMYSVHDPPPCPARAPNGRSMSRDRRKHKKEYEKESGVVIEGRELTLEERMKIEARRWFKTREDLSDLDMLCGFLVATKDLR